MNANSSMVSNLGNLGMGTVLRTAYCLGGFTEEAIFELKPEGCVEVYLG